MHFKHRRGIGKHHRDGVAASDAMLGQRRGEAARAGVEVPVVDLPLAVDDRRVLGEHRCRALQEGQGRQRLEIRGVAVEIDIVGRALRHCVILAPRA